MRFIIQFLGLFATFLALVFPPAFSIAGPIADKAAAKVEPAAGDDPAPAKTVKKAPAEKAAKINTAAIKKAEDYLNSLSSARARFVQTTHDGTQLVGTFFLQRPGKLRFEYDPPVKDFVVADGIFIYFYDAELKEQSNAPIGQTLADFILRPNLKLSDDLTVRSTQSAGGLLQIDIVQSADPEAGVLTLGFREEPFTLKKWRIKDAQGMINEVELFYLKTDITHPSDLFAYKNPDKDSSLND